MPLYALSLQAQYKKTGETEHAPLTVVADNDQDAKRAAMHDALKIWPKEEGWTAHSIKVFLFT